MIQMDNNQNGEDTLGYVTSGVTQVIFPEKQQIILISLNSFFGSNT
jgi:hypothetical protein